MRRLVHGLSLCLVAASAVMVIAGCGGLGTVERLPPGTFGSGSNSPFVGQFTETSIAVNGSTVVCPGTLSAGGVVYSCEAIVRLFVADGSFDDTSPLDQIGTGNWSVTGNNITITKNGVTASYGAGFTPDQSSFQLTSGVLTQTWTRN